MDLGFPLASRILGADPFFHEGMSGSSFGEWPVGTTFRRPFLGGTRTRGTGGVYSIPCDMYEKEGKYEYRFELAGCGKPDIC